MEKKTRGRPKLPARDRRSERVSFRIRIDEKRSLRLAAKRAGESSIGAWLLDVGLRAARR